MSALGQERTLRQVEGMSAIPSKADILRRNCHVRFFSNRPFGVKHFQTVHVAVC
jgi:hypothetical protein